MQVHDQCKPVKDYKAPESVIFLLPLLFCVSAPLHAAVAVPGCRVSESARFSLLFNQISGLI